MSIHKTEAIILRKRDYRETSLLVDFFSRDFGRLSGIMKGIRSEPHKFGSTVEPFSHNDIVFYRSRSSTLHLISQCDIKDNFDTLRQDISKATNGACIAEMLHALMPPEDRNEAVFDLSVNCLRQMKDTQNPGKVAAIFKIKILALSGFKPHFDSCVSCSVRISGQSRFSLSLGGLLCPACFPKDISSRPIFRGTIATILHIERSDLRSALTIGLNPDIRRELEMILNAFLHFHLEKELKSFKVIRKLEACIPCSVEGGGQ